MLYFIGQIIFIATPGVHKPHHLVEISPLIKCLISNKSAVATILFIISFPSLLLSSFTLLKKFFFHHCLNRFNVELNNPSVHLVLIAYFRVHDINQIPLQDQSFCCKNI